MPADAKMYDNYADWANDHRWVRDMTEAERQRGLDLLLEAIASGAISELDGRHSPVTRRIRERHGVELQIEMNGNWVASPQDWQCPGCRRDKFEISRIGPKGHILCKSVVHHDHMDAALKKAFHQAFVSAGTAMAQVEGLMLIERLGVAFSAYDRILICEDCNIADIEAKKLAAAPSQFSFSVSQIRSFILPGAHAPHKVAREKAVRAWEAAKGAFTLRMALIETVAEAAATRKHWFEPHPPGSPPIPVFGDGGVKIPMVSPFFSGTTEFLKTLGMNTLVTPPNVSRWRLEPKKPGKVLPHNYLALLMSDKGSAMVWKEVEDNWHCPICKRSKHETVYLSDTGKPTFHRKTTGKVDTWRNAPVICNQCNSTLMSLKTEIKFHVGDFSSSYRFVRPSDLAGIISARPHSPHRIKEGPAADLVQAILVEKRYLL